MTVTDVPEYLAGGMTGEEILSEYPAADKTEYAGVRSRRVGAFTPKVRSAPVDA